MDSALEKLDINASARDIEDYLERFEIWCMAKGNVKEDTKPALFLNFIGKDAYALIKNLTFSDSPISMPYEKIRNALLQHVRPMNFEAAGRAKFNTLMRSENQSVRDFVLVLQTQAVKCNYGEQLQMQLRDRLIAGINIPELKQKLLLMVDPTFQNVRQVNNMNIYVNNMKMCCMLRQQKILFCLIRPRIQIRKRLAILNNSKNPLIIACRKISKEIHIDLEVLNQNNSWENMFLVVAFIQDIPVLTEKLSVSSVGK